MKSLLCAILMCLPGLWGDETKNVSATALNNLGSRYYASGSYRMAASCFEEALALENREQRRIPEKIATISLNLAATYRAQARFNEAESLYRSVISTRQALFGADDVSLTVPLDGLALVYSCTGKFLQAEEAAAQALQIAEHSAVASLSRAEAMRDLANVYFIAGKYQKAELLLQQVVLTLQQASEQGSVCYAEVLSLRGLLYRTQLKFKEAEVEYRAAILIFELTLGKDHPSTTATWNNLAGVLAAQGQWQEAEVIFKRCIALWQKVYGAEHPSVASGFTNLAGIYLSQKHYVQSKILYQKAWEIDTKVLGRESVKSSTDLSNLGLVALRRHRLPEAEHYFSQALTIQERLLGPNHPDTEFPLVNLASVYYREKRFAEAEPLLRRAVEVREHAFESDVQLSQLLENYAKILRLNQKFSEAARVDARLTGIQVRKARQAEMSDPFAEQTRKSQP